ncbi:MAG: methyltransferase domain-containing protein [Paludibacteraceae bacterium]|nr:methyltransferase domain-containing protein [Paludibacteraceae bacterium]
MFLFDNLKRAFSKERYNAQQAQEMAHLYSWGPVIFQVCRLMIKYGILDLLNEHKEGLTQTQIAQATGLSEYATKCLLEASLTTHIVLIDPETDIYRLGKTGWFLLRDAMIRADIDFNHDVNYEGWFVLDKALEEGRPAGLEHFGNWPTIYEGLSSLPEQVQKSWFGFDHYYSDHSFDEALEIISQQPTANSQQLHLLDVGGNTGRFAMRCVAYNPSIEVTVCDLPQQIGLMQKATSGKEGAERIHGVGMNILDEHNTFPTDKRYDVIWMSQFLDCFSEQQIVSILRRAAAILDADNRIFIMETLWDRQDYTPAAMSLTMTSLYFTALANGNSKMYNTDDMTRLIREAGLEVESIHDRIGNGGHSILVCKQAI